MDPPLCIIIPSLEMFYLSLTMQSFHGDWHMRSYKFISFRVDHSIAYNIYVPHSPGCMASEMMGWCVSSSGV
jgi:hypothetical protein